MFVKGTYGLSTLWWRSAPITWLQVHVFVAVSWHDLPPWGDRAAVELHYIRPYRLMLFQLIAIFKEVER